MKSLQELALEFGGDEEALHDAMASSVATFAPNLTHSDHLNIIHNRIDSVATFVLSQIVNVTDLEEVSKEMAKFLSFDRLAQAYNVLASKTQANKLIVPK